MCPFLLQQFPLLPSGNLLLILESQLEKSQGGRHSFPSEMLSGKPLWNRCSLGLWECCQDKDSWDFRNLGELQEAEGRDSILSMGASSSARSTGRRKASVVL